MHGFLPSRRSVPVVRKEELAEGVFSLSIRDGYAARNSAAGQFVNVYTHDGQKLFPRPLGVCGTDGDTVSFIFAVVGGGTAEISSLEAGDYVDILGPLGKPYSIEDNREYLLVGGGLGIPPLIYAAQKIADMQGVWTTALFGYRDTRFADSIIGRYADTAYSITNAEGNVITLLDRWDHGKRHYTGSSEGGSAEILCCGPEAMMRAVHRWAAAHGMPAQFSLEERMGCGYGACFACVAPTVTGYRKVCLDGPVFSAEELVWGQGKEGGR